MANSPEDDAHIELHVRRMASGAFTEYVFTKMKEKDILRFEGPAGYLLSTRGQRQTNGVSGQRHRVRTDQESLCSTHSTPA
jgi:ferredoxin-NADP reductase